MQFKKREKQSWRSVTFSKVADCITSEEQEKISVGPFRTTDEKVKKAMAIAIFLVPT